MFSTAEPESRIYAKLLFSEKPLRVKEEKITNIELNKSAVLLGFW